MYRNARLRATAAVAAIICLLFSQLAVAAYPCPAPLHSAAAAMVAHATDRGDHGNDPCAEHDATRPGLCLAHCNPADLSLNQPQVDTPPVMLVAVHPLADHCPPAVLVSAVPQLEVPLHGHSPPLSILHCCFRI